MTYQLRYSKSYIELLNYQGNRYISLDSPTFKLYFLDLIFFHVIDLVLDMQHSKCLFFWIHACHIVTITSNKKEHICENLSYWPIYKEITNGISRVNRLCHIEGGRV